MMKIGKVSALLLAIGAASLGAQAPATLLGYKTTVPSGWVAKTPSSTMRLAEYSAGQADVVVYFFGKSQGGTLEANTERWRSQFSNPDGSAVKEKITQDIAAFPITFAEYRGSYARGVGTGMPAEAAKPGQQLLVAIVETPNGALYVQLFGAEAAVDAQHAALKQFVKELKP